MKTKLLLVLVLVLVLDLPLRADTPIKDLKVSGASQIASGTFNIKTGVTVTYESGSILNLSGATVTFADNQIPWVKVNKCGSAFADISGIAGPGQLSRHVDSQSGTTYTA